MLGLFQRSGTDGRINGWRGILTLNHHHGDRLGAYFSHFLRLMIAHYDSEKMDAIAAVLVATRSKIDVARVPDGQVFLFSRGGCKPGVIIET